ncbi:MAG: nicotinate-nucleotide adenylyltransferase [Anaerolineales bacterium]|jgi:nicotinate-nucleotide adenylyltransferase
MSRRLGIFGGTFDPPHLGHQILASESLSQLRLDKVLWVLTPDPPHKRGKIISPLKDRLDMLSAAITGHPDFELSRIEIDRPPPHYAVDTVHLLLQQNPGTKMIYLMGGDSLSDLPEWYNSIDFVNSCHKIGVLRRPGYDINLNILENEIPGIKNKIEFVETPLIEIAASDIRQMVKSGISVREFLHPEVYQIIRERNLYQS